MAIRIAWLEKRLAQIEAGGALAARIESRRKGIVTARKAHRRNERRALSLKIEFHKKLSMSFACLAFVLLGIPLGLASRQKSRALGLGLGSAVAFCGYYPPMLVGDTLAEAQMIPPWAGMWLPVALVALIGLVWTLRAVRR